jgi:hypothetical protein
MKCCTFPTGKAGACNQTVHRLSGDLAIPETSGFMASGSTVENHNPYSKDKDSSQ